MFIIIIEWSLTTPQIIAREKYTKICNVFDEYVEKRDNGDYDFDRITVYDAMIYPKELTTRKWK